MRRIVRWAFLQAGAWSAVTLAPGGACGAVGDGWPALSRGDAQTASGYKTAAARTERLYASKWGVFNHFLAYGCKTSAEWNRKVEGLDVERMAESLASCGVRFCVFTLMQQTRYMCAPNATYDRIAGVKPGEACSRRDLVADLAVALGKRGIDLYLYVTGEGPCRDAEVGERFGFRGGKVSRAFVEKWAAVLGEYAVRYGERVKGWWIDACYRGGHGYDDTLTGLYAQAIWSGNAKALVTVSDGRKPGFTRAFACEDFTFAEFDDFLILPPGRFTDGSQNMVLGPMGRGENGGGGWFQKGCLHDGTYLADYVSLVNRQGGVVTIDVLLHPDGTFEEDHLEALRAVGLKIGTLNKKK